MFSLDRTKALSSILTVFEERKEELRIESYSVYQTSLEEIFTRLALEEPIGKEQEVEEAAGLTIDPSLAPLEEDTRVL